MIAAKSTTICGNDSARITRRPSSLSSSRWWASTTSSRSWRTRSASNSRTPLGAFRRRGRIPAVTELILVDQPAPHVTRLTLNRPDQLNAMTAELCEALHAALRSVGADRACRAVILTGAGRAFCAGLDLHGYGTAPENTGSDEPRDRLANQQ